MYFTIHGKNIEFNAEHHDVSSTKAREIWKPAKYDGGRGGSGVGLKVERDFDRYMLVICVCRKWKEGNCGGEKLFAREENY